MRVEIKNLKSIFLDRALEAQDAFWAEKIYRDLPDKIMFAEHEPVYTVGVAARDNLELLKKCFSVPIYRIPCSCTVTGRGGLATYQGPGILSVYCIFKIQNFSPSEFNNMLISSAEEVLKHYKIASSRRPENPGLYVGKDKKIVSIGLKYSKGITRFGMALSVNPHPKYIEPLIPCGIPGVRLTSIKEETGREPDANDLNLITAILSEKIIELFGKNKTR